MDDIVWSSITAKLPTVYDAVLNIYSHATQPDSPKMNKTIHQYAMDLIAVWKKSFGSDHVLSVTSVKYKVKKLVKNYWNQVYSKAHRNTANKKEEDGDKCPAAASESLRKLNEKWQKMNNMLLDIGKDMDALDADGDERIFYEQQKSSREGRVTNDVDEEYVEEQTIQQEHTLEIVQQQEAEEAFIMEDIDDPDEQPGQPCLNSTMNADSSLNVSSNRSGLVCLKPVGVDIGIQTHLAVPDRPRLRIKKRICTDEIKSTCAMLSSTCGVSCRNVEKNHSNRM